MPLITIYYGVVEVRQLKSFEAVVRCGGFTRAADDLLIAQPAVSAHIQRLERDLGVQLLHRGRTVELTAAGHRFLPFARSALAQLHDGAAAVQELKGLSLGRVRVGVTPLTGDLDVVARLARYRRLFPGVSITLRTRLIAALVDDLAIGKLDVVVGPAVNDPPGDLAMHPVTEERLVLITAASDGRRITSLREVAGDAFVCLPQDSGLRRLLDRAFASFSLTPRVDFETDSPQSIRELVAAGLGSALIAESVLAESVLGSRQGDVRVHRLPGLPEHPPICVFTAPKTTNPAAAKFATELLAGAGEVGVARVD